MTTAYTSLLGLALPVTGELAAYEAALAAEIESNTPAPAD